MKVNNVFDAIGALITLAIIAVFFTKPNTASDVNAVGNQFTNGLKTAEAG